MQKVIDGLQILNKYPHASFHSGGFDFVYVVCTKEVSPEDAIQLKQLNWHWDVELDAWKHRVY